MAESRELVCYLRECLETLTIEQFAVVTSLPLQVTQISFPVTELMINVQL